MSCIEYPSVSSYLITAQSVRDKIIMIDALIDKAILLMADTIDGAGGNISAYELDDGQIRIKTTYRSINDVKAGIEGLEAMKNMYINQLNGRRTRLRDRSSFR